MSKGKSGKKKNLEDFFFKLKKLINAERRKIYSNNCKIHQLDVFQLLNINFHNLKPIMFP